MKKPWQFTFWEYCGWAVPVGKNGDEMMFCPRVRGTLCQAQVLVRAPPAFSRLIFEILIDLDIASSTPNCTAMKQNASSVLLSAFQGLKISPATVLRPILITTTSKLVSPSAAITHVRLFSATATRAGSWLEPQIDRRKKMMKGRPRVPTGGSTKGTTVIWGDYGLRMWDHHRRISAEQLKLAETTIKARLRGEKYRLYKRVACNVGVFVSGNEVGYARAGRRPLLTKRR